MTSSQHLAVPEQAWCFVDGRPGSPREILLSIIVPAFNEERYLPACLQSIHAACALVFPSSDRAAPAGDHAAPSGYEVLVTDNNSTDATALIARQHGARVVFEPVNQISRARNAGAAAAQGRWLLFLDADSRLHPATLRELLDTMTQARCVGGGSVIGLDRAPWWGVASLQLWNVAACFLRLASGSFLFCRADALRELGGFSSELYAAEDLDLSARLKHWGRSRGLSFEMLRGRPHVSSGRKFELYSNREIVSHFFRSLVLLRRTARKRSELGFFYDGRR